MPLIEAEHLSFTYGRGTAEEQRVLTDISFAIEPGEFIGLAGRSGSGKTTLVKHLNGLLRPEKGRILFHGRDVAEKSFHKTELHRRVGLVFQYPERQLFRGTVLEDVAYGPENLGCSREEARAAAQAAMELVGLGVEFASKSPLDLSGGEMRRAAIAGVLAMEPELLILDEPAAGLDPRAKDGLFALLERLRREKHTAVFLISHSMEDLACHTERMLLLDGGRLLKDGAPEEIFQDAALMRRIGVDVPQVTAVAEMLRRDAAIPVLPVTEDAAVQLFAELLGGAS